MRAITLHRHGDASVLAPEALPDPVVGPGQALVAIEACALNRLDLWVRGGLPNLRLTYPHVLGSDIAGRVLETGPGVDPAWRDRAVVLNPGLSRERVRQLEQRVKPKLRRSLADLAPEGAVMAEAA